jgi:DNA invertase Pin-like site-specific DNA recombinase
MADVAYIRVSGSDQNMDRQLADCDVVFLKTFTDQASGKNTDRPGLQNCLEYLREGDTLHVHGIDRLARSLHDLQTLVAMLVNKGVTVRFHAENLIFTGNDTDPFATLLLQGA